MHTDRFAALLALSLGSLLVFIAHGQTENRIVIDGSTGVMPLATSLAKAYQERSPDVTIEMGKGLGTKARLQALVEGKVDIALASHGLEATEVSRQGMAAHEIARMAVVFGVNAAVPVVNVTDQQICDVYSGKVSNWKALGGPDMELAARTRPDSEVDAEVMRANVACLKNLSMPASVKVMQRSGDMAKELATTAGAMGITTMTVVEQSQGKIRPLSVNGVAPSRENVAGNTYPLVRQSFFVVKAPPPPAVAKFLEFTRSPAGDKVISANGALPAKR
jgi:phosphate transport system substrate-binding protein